MNAEKLEDALHFENRFTNELPADPIEDNYVRQVRRLLFSRATSKGGTALPGRPFERSLIYSTCRSALPNVEFANVFVGNRALPGMDPHAAAMGGTSSHWAGQLGDGRAINLGEIVNGQGQRWVRK